jgi:hypothetical protein
MVDRFVEDILGSHPGDVGAHSCLMVSRLAAQITSELRNKRPEHFYQVAYFNYVVIKQTPTNRTLKTKAAS